MPAELPADDPVAAAHRLLGAVITAHGVSARIVEVEAYGGPPGGLWPDPAAHSYPGPSVRNAVMFGPPGRLYIYRSHGIHLCANVSCGPEGSAAAVLLRAAEVRAGIGTARHRRGEAVPDHALARGPGNLCAALGIAMSDAGTDLFDPGSAVRMSLSRTRPRRQDGPRVGVSKAADRHWRLWLAGSAAVSAYRRSPRAPRPGDSD